MIADRRPLHDDEAGAPMLQTGMVTISISAEACRAITGRLPEPSKRDDRGGYGFVVDHRTLDRLKAARGPGESYSDAIIRLAKGELGQR